MPLTMGAAERSEPWLLRLCAALGIGPLALGTGMLLGLAGLFLLQELLLGRFSAAALAADPLLWAMDGRVTLTHIAVVAYLAAAGVHAARACDRSVERIAPLLAAPPPAEGRRDWRSTRSVLRWATAAALGFGTLVSSAVSPGAVSYWPSTWTPETAWHRVLGVAIAVGLFRLAALLAVDSLRISSLGAAIERVDLLDAEALAPFARHGLVNVLVVTGFVAVYSLFLVDLSYAGIFAVVFVPMGVAAALGLLLPMWGVRGRVREAKRAELAWCRERVHERRRRLDGRGAGEDAPLDELLAWERRVESVREWPLDASGLVRLALYLLIPLGSWSGGALVERVVDAALD